MYRIFFNLSLLASLMFFYSCNEKIQTSLNAERTINSASEDDLSQRIQDGLDLLPGKSLDQQKSICTQIMKECDSSSLSICDLARAICSDIFEKDEDDNSNGGDPDDDPDGRTDDDDNSNGGDPDDDNSNGGDPDDDNSNGDDPEDDPAPPSGPNPPVIDKSGLNSCSDWNSYLGVNDPYVCYQWHIVANNQGIPHNGTRYAKTSDLRVGKVYDEFTGKNVRVHVTDSGMDHVHEDLNANYTISLSRHYGQSSTQDRNPTETGTHGTQVSGLIGSVGNNGKGGMGVGYDVLMSGDNLISSYQQLVYFNDAYKKTSVIDLWNGSFGYPFNSVKNHQQRTSSNTQAASAVFGATQNNITYFKANGNDGAYNGADGNLEGQASVYVINTIAALGVSNEVVSYSTPGANLALSGYANLGGSNLGTCTTTTNNRYTCGFNGTSSATPSVTGAAAVVLEALRSKVTNPKWTDLTYVLIKTANKNVIDRTSKYTGSIATESRSSYKVTNSFGLEHSFDHGFGSVDVNAAVHEAKQYTTSRLIPNPSEKNYNSSSSVSLSTGSCKDQTISVPDNFQVWSTEVAISQTGVEQRNLGIFLVMPDGKKVMVKNTGSYAVLKTLGYNQVFNVRAPMGINAKGTWKVRVCSKSGSGTYNGASLKIYGFSDTDTLE